MKERVYHPDSNHIYQGLHARLKELRARADRAEDALETGDTEGGDLDGYVSDYEYEDDPADMDYGVTPESPTPPTAEPPTCPPTPADEKTKRRILPNAADFSEYTHWKKNVKDMVDPYLSYTNKSLGKPAERVDVIARHHCECVELKTTSLTCLYFDRTSCLPPFHIPADLITY